MKERIHDRRATLLNLIERVKKSSISEKNKKYILEFKDHLLLDGFSFGRIVKYVYYLSKLASILNKDFDKASIQDLKSLVIGIDQTDYCESTKKEIKIYIKKLYKWIYNEEEYPEIVRWIKPQTRRIEKIKLPEEMLSEDDVQKLIDYASKARDKAFVSTLYESGCRIGELLFLRIKNLKIDEYGAILLIPPMKTGSRRVRIISSTPYLTKWINEHPSRNDPNAYIWLNNKGTALSYGWVQGKLSKLGLKAGIKKKLNPHNFRHSRATHLANHLTEAQMKEFFGWTQGSEMAAVYVHLSGRDVDDAILNVYGMKTEKNRKESILTPKTCQRCEESNPSGNKFCSKCGLPLDKETINQVIQSEFERKKADSILDEMLKIPQYRDIFSEMINKVMAGKTSI